MSVRRVVTAVAAAAALTACGAGGSPGSADTSHAGGSTPTTGQPDAPTSSSSAPVGSPRHPVAVPPQEDLLSWTPVPGSTKDVVTVGDGWTMTVTAGGDSARLEGAHARTIRAGAHSTISDAFLSDTHALVVGEDRLASAADRATLVDLGSGRATVLDRTSRPPTVVGGTWALGPDTLAHATSGPGHRYCLASVDLTTGAGTTGWCAPRRHGFSRATITSSAETMMVFDDHHPSCRTLVEVRGADLVPIPGVTHCKGWDSALTDSGTVWSVVPKERRIEAAHFYAHSPSGWYDLGPGNSGSLVVCAGSAYFARDPQGRTDPATLLRWSADDATLSTVFESRGRGNAFLSPPRCGGNHLTVTAYSQAGDEQVTTDLG
jgi:hypothetical protein